MTEPYTPSLEEVRGAYHAWSDGQGDSHPRKPTWSKAEFDRWLAEHDEAVRAEERQKAAQISLTWDGGTWDATSGPGQIAAQILAQGKESRAHD